MTSNADIEMRWINAWSEVYEIVGTRTDVPCQLPDASIVSLNECLAWIQNLVYQGLTVQIEEGWVGHRRGVLVR